MAGAFSWHFGAGRPAGGALPWALASFGLASAGQVAPPLCALAAGFALLFVFRGTGRLVETAAIVCIYFVAQTGMNLYMKSVLSQEVVDESAGFKGVPIGFLVTAIQQFVAFFVFCSYLWVGKLMGRGYRVKQFSNWTAYFAVFCFSVFAALNLGLNNFSLSLVAISINMVIRGCLPLFAAVSQTLVDSALGRDRKAIPAMDWLLMIAGVCCACLATYAKSKASDSIEDSESLRLGVVVCVASVFAGALSMVLAGVLGSELKLKPAETTCYMALPAGLVLLAPAFAVPHPMGTWPGSPHMTDWQVLKEVMERKPTVLLPVLFSGVLAFLYNILQYWLVHKLSAAHAAFAGNFNKAATVVLFLALGLERLPEGGYNAMFLLAVAGDIAAFTMYSVRKAR
uniref:Sugar phosphate transporter domain-containing protein n=1 Tax=Zooxanthella nutricula TaxID=1333877 RepID=A0A7S2Q4I0_9DINO